MSTREGKYRATMTRPEKETRRKRNEPTDHAVARGRDVSLRYEGGHNPENHTVVSEWCWKPPTDRSGNESSKRPERTNQSPSSAEHVVVNYTTKDPEHLPRANDHEERNAE